MTQNSTQKKKRMTVKDLSEQVDKLSNSMDRFLEMQMKMLQNQNGSAQAAPAAKNISQNPVGGVDTPQKSGIMPSTKTPIRSGSEYTAVGTKPGQEQRACYVKSFEPKKRENKFVELMGGQAKLDKEAAKDRRIDKILSGDLDLTARGERVIPTVNATCKRCSGLFCIQEQFAEYDPDSRQHVFTCDNCIPKG